MQANKQLEQEQKTDAVTNDLLYKLLLEVLEHPFPRRSMVIFPSGKERKLVNEDGGGIKTDFHAIDKYLDEIIGHIMGNKLSVIMLLEKESAFIENLLTPIARNPLQVMYTLQNADLGTCEHFENIALK